MTCRRLCGVCGLIRYIKVGSGSEQRSGEAKLIKIQDAHSWMVGCTGICSAPNNLFTKRNSPYS